MKFFGALFLIAILGVVVVQVYDLNVQRHELQAKIAAESAQASALAAENDKLARDLEFYKNDTNLSKEARARLNVHAPGEKQVNLVPKQ